MHSLQRRKSFHAFLEAVRPISQSVQVKLRPFQEAKELLADLVDADDPKCKLASYGKAIRDAYGINADKFFRMDLIGVAIMNNFIGEHRSISNELLMGAVADNWTAFDDLNANFIGGVRWKILDDLPELAHFITLVIEQRLIEECRPSVHEEMNKHELTIHEVESFSEGRKDLPRYLSKLIQDEEEEPDDEELSLQPFAQGNAAQDYGEGLEREAKVETTHKQSVSLDKEIQAIATIGKWQVEGRAWTEEDVAKAVGVDRRTLYRWSLYQRAKQGMKIADSPPLKGSKTDGIADAGIEDDEIED